MSLLTLFQCDDIDANDDWHRCEDGLQIELGECFEGCGTDSLCLIDCSSDFEIALKDCPCMENCPDGCPCPNWDCDVQVPGVVSESLCLDVHCFTWMYMDVRGCTGSYING